MRRLPYQLCDVFTERALTGNALAVFTDAAGLDDETLQALAREMNLSESTFVLAPASGDADARIRIFTPAVELPFAGHPVLGTAFVLAGPVRTDRLVRLETGRGVVPVRLAPRPDRAPFGWMTQPLPAREPFGAAEELLAGLGMRRSRLPIELYDNGPRHVQVELETAAGVAAVRPDLQRLARLGSLAISVFARNGDRWKTRVFAPGEGIAEDPATGAAAGPLAVHLARHGRVEFGEEIVIDQGAEMLRPSTLHARVFGGPERLERVEVGGSAVVIARGELELP
jgi:trans-2,3-dihydro-3-hydroxyanthranilate isomerase